MSDRALWLDEWCPTCRAAPGARCRVHYLSKTRPPTPLHVARGWRGRSCPTCKALPGERCSNPSGREASRIHQARLRPGRRELLSGESVWQELEARGATIATVPFSGRAGRGGRTDRIVLSRARSRRAGRRRAVDRTRRALLRARGADLGSVRVVCRSAADRRDRHLDGGRPPRRDRRTTRRQALRGARVSGLEVVPPRRTRLWIGARTTNLTDAKDRAGTRSSIHRRRRRRTKSPARSVPSRRTDSKAGTVVCARSRSV